MAKKSDITKTFKWRISQIPQILEWVEKQDVDGLSRFLVQSPNIPLYCFSSGGASSSLHYCALLYETNKGMAKALTPLMMTSLSDETLKNSKILLFSKSGHGIDEEQIVKRAVKVNPQGVYAMSRDNDKENHLIQTVIEKTGTNNWLQFKWPEFEDAFISSTSPFAIMGLFYKAFTGDSDIVSKLNTDLTSSNCYSYKTKRGDIIEEPKSNIKTFIALYSGWSEPTAIDFESKMVESGIASVQLCDYRNFCHGRFIFLSNHLEDSAFVLFVTPREKEFVRRFIYEAKGDMGQRELFPSDTKIITIETELDSPLATIDLMIKTSVCFMDIAKDYGQEPLSPTNPYKIDKRCPRSFPYTGLVKTPLMSNVIQGKKGTLKGVNRRKQIIYDAYKSIAELAEKNGVEEPTVRKYIRAHKIDRNRDLQMIQYNKVWEEFVKDSTRSKASIARTLGISENTLKFYLSMKTPPKTDEGKNGTVAESKPLTKLREKLKDKEWDLNLTYKDGAVFKETDEKRQEKAIPEPTEGSSANTEELPTLITNEASEGEIFLKPDMEVNGYYLYCCFTPLEAQAVKNTRWCYCNSEYMYKRYTKESGFLFVAAKKGYVNIENPYKGGDLEYRFKLYDDFANSLISLTTFINPKTNEADVFSVTFRRNDTSRHYEGQHQGTYDEMIAKANELLGGFDIEAYCIEKTKERLGAQPIPQEVKKESKGKIRYANNLEGIDEELRKKFKKLKIKSLKELFKLRDAILVKEKKRADKCKAKYAKAKPLTWDDFSFRKTHIYDTSKMDCWSFNSNTDVRNGISLDVGNMSNGFGVNILGIDFKNSEVPYQLAIFKNDEVSVAVQKEIADPSNPLFSNGLGMKRNYIYGKKYEPYRRDTDFELGKQYWCYEWMKVVVWEKVKQNKEFRDILLSIPQNAMIVEQAQKKSHVMWGCWNEELMKERKIIRLADAVESGKPYNSPKVKSSIYQVNCASQWVGENAMGQILTMAKLALNQGVQLPINVQLLNEANICWFGDVLVFTEQQDGSVTVEAKPTDVQDKPQDAIQKPLKPKLAKTKVTVAKETKKTQEVRKSDASFETKGIIEANLELTEQNKASKKEMLSIKSGELLDDLLK